ncbi:MAG TPA: ATP-binding protein [Stellaceae bacterium]|nr:ATP-binding protein [Stellaceae bacterium]
MGSPNFNYEDFFDAIMSASPSSILIIDDRLTVLHANRTFLETRHAADRELIGRRFRDVFPGAFEDVGLDARIFDALRSGAGVRRGRTSCRAAGMPARVYSYSICPLPLRRGGRAAVLVMDEVTSRLRVSGPPRPRTAGSGEGAEDALAEPGAIEAQSRQTEKLAALGMVIGGIAHEIRNPLGVSSAAAQLLKHRAGSPAMQQECIEKVIDGIARASRVVESLLRFARPGRMRETTQVDLVEVLRNALLFASSGEATAGVTVAWSVEGAAEPAAAPLCADGVQNLLELVMINVIANAFQAMPAGGRLSLGVRRAAHDIVVEIGDTGCGIPEADLPRIFDPFFTTRSDTRRAGLGLSVSHSIVQQHGGGITVRSSPGEGTLFAIRLRASAAPAG